MAKNYKPIVTEIESKKSDNGETDKNFCVTGGAELPPPCVNGPNENNLCSVGTGNLPNKNICQSGRKG